MSLIDFALVLKLMNKFLFAFDMPDDSRILEKVVLLVEKAKNSSFDEDVRAMLPFTFRGITQVYY